MNRVQYFLKRHSTLILSMVASGGVVVTTVLAVKATPKAMQLLEEAKLKEGRELTKLEKIKYGYKPFIFCGISGISTITCMLSTGYLSEKTQASIMSAYALLDNSFKEYRENIKKISSEDTDFLARQEIVRALYDPNEISIENDEECLFFDYQSMRFFTSSMQHVMQAENKFLESFHTKGYGCMNEWYDYLGIPHVTYGYQLGWADIENCEPYNVKEVSFEYQKIIVGGDIECWVITATMPATFDYII